MSNQLIERETTAVQAINPATKLIEMALTSNADIDKLERLMAMQTAWEDKAAKKDFLDALSKFQSKCPDIKKMKQGHNYKYAPLSDIVSQTRELISECGLSYRFEQEHNNGLIKVTCILSHSSGHCEKNTMVSNPDTSGSKNAIQAIGSAVQYMMRYTFIGALGITTADEDMDGRLPVDNKPPAQELMISQDIELKIKSLIAEKGKNESGFLSYVGKAWKRDIQSVSDMSMKEADWAVRYLEQIK